MIVIIENVISSADPMTIVADMILLLCTCLNITYALATSFMCNVVYTHDQ